MWGWGSGGDEVVRCGEADAAWNHADQEVLACEVYGSGFRFMVQGSWFQVYGFCN